MAQITATLVGSTGGLISFAGAASTGDKYYNTGDEVPIFSGGTAAATATITPVLASLNVAGAGDVAVPTITMVIGTASFRMGPKLPRAAYNDGQGSVNIAYSAVNTIGIAVMRVPKPNP